MMIEEVWKPVEGFSYYEVSNFGRVRSIDRIVFAESYGKFKNPKYIKRRSKILKFTPDKDGYYRVNIYANSKVKNLSVHQLVALAFVANPNNYKQVNHIDWIKSNNASWNLEWTSSYINHQHSMKLGLTKAGSNKYNAKLNEEKARFIVGNIGKISQATMAKMFGVSTVTINKVTKGITWSHATGVPKDDRAYKIRRRYE